MLLICREVYSPQKGICNLQMTMSLFTRDGQGTDFEDSLGRRVVGSFCAGWENKAVISSLLLPPTRQGNAFYVESI